MTHARCCFLFLSTDAALRCLLLTAAGGVWSSCGREKGIVAHLRASHTSEECLKGALRRGVRPRNLRWGSTATCRSLRIYLLLNTVL